MHCCSPVLFLQTFSHGPYEKTDQLPITYFVWVVGIKTATEISWASITLCFFGHQNNMEMTEMVSAENYCTGTWGVWTLVGNPREVFSLRRNCQLKMFGLNGACLGFQVFFCKCLDSQDIARAWAVCAQLGPYLDSQGSLQDLASLSCLSSVGTLLLSSVGAVFLSSVWAACPLLEFLDSNPCWAEAIYQTRSFQSGQFILRDIDCRSTVCENGKRYQRCSR